MAETVKELTDARAIADEVCRKLTSSMQYPQFGDSEVPVKVAARVMSKNLDWIRNNIENGKLPIGICTKDGDNRRNFYISPKLFWELTGYVWKGEENSNNMKILKRIVPILLLLVMAMNFKADAKESNFYGSSNEFTVYGYCPCEECCGKTDGITFTETKAMQGRTIAVDKSVIPLGSTVLIYYEDSLVGIYQAEDTGGDIKGNKIDMYFENHNDAHDWGIKDCEVVIVDAKG